jgi:hypothetical protein
LSSLIIDYEMRYTKEELSRKIKDQRLICLVDGWLLEHYEKQLANLDQEESPAADPSDWGLEDGNQDKEHSAYAGSIHD